MRFDRLCGRWAQDPQQCASGGGHTDRYVGVRRGGGSDQQCVVHRGSGFDHRTLYAEFARVQRQSGAVRNYVVGTCAFRLSGRQRLAGGRCGKPGGGRYGGI